MVADWYSRPIGFPSSSLSFFLFSQNVYSCNLVDYRFRNCLAFGLLARKYVINTTSNTTSTRYSNPKSNHLTTNNIMTGQVSSSSSQYTFCKNVGKSSQCEMFLVKETSELANVCNFILHNKLLSHTMCNFSIPANLFILVNKN